MKKDPHQSFFSTPIFYFFYCVWYPSSVRQTSTLATAALKCAGVVDENNTKNIIAPSKVAYWRNKVTKKSQQEDKENLKESQLKCEMFDGRIDQSKAIKQSVVDKVTKYCP